MPGWRGDGEEGSGGQRAAHSSLRSLFAVERVLTKSVLLTGSLAGLAGLAGLALGGGGAALLLLVGLLALLLLATHTAESTLSLLEEVHCCC